MYLFSGNKNKVIVPVEEVREFMRTWPCLRKLRNRSYWFEFDRGGNLVDTDVPEQDDGPAALALAEKAEWFWRDAQGVLP